MAIRNFKTSTSRNQESLNGWWKVKEDKAHEENTIWVPSSWEYHPEYRNVRGKMIYSRDLKIEEDGYYRILFAGVGHWATVYLNSQLLMEHYDSHTGFVTNPVFLSVGTAHLTVVVDNDWSEESTLHIPNDYFSYGGILRPVVFEKVPPIFIENVFVFTNNIVQSTWSIRLSITLNSVAQLNLDQLDLSSIITCIRLDGKFLVQVELDQHMIQTIIDHNTLTYEVEIDVHNVQEWSPAEPFLYFIETEIDYLEYGDNLIERIGFRTVKVQHEDILLNGHKIIIRGVNRHEDHPSYGAAIPVEQMVNDLMNVKRLGANAVRTAHYPNDQRFLDLCDELGLMIWEENHARGLTIEEMEKENFLNQSLTVTEEMVIQHINHPSIIIWGILNECDTTNKKSEKIYSEHIKRIKNIDSSRPVSFATHLLFKDLCLGLADIISINTYPRWYHDIEPGKQMQKIIAWVDASGGNQKPILVTETGAGGIYGFRDDFQVKWSEERQASIVIEAIEEYSANTRLSGIFLWQLFDIRVSDENNWPIRRPRTRNNKGLLDEYRRPKLAFQAVRKLWSGT